MSALSINGLEHGEDAGHAARAGEKAFAPGPFGYAQVIRRRRDDVTVLVIALEAAHGLQTHESDERTSRIDRATATRAPNARHGAGR
jgi:hypothetical protein